MVSVDVKHHVYLLDRSRDCEPMTSTSTLTQLLISVEQAFVHSNIVYIFYVSLKPQFTQTTADSHTGTDGANQGRPLPVYGLNYSIHYEDCDLGLEDE